MAVLGGLTNRLERLAAVSSRLRLRQGRERRSDKGELWLDHLCLFHQDDHRSATWQEDSAVYHCRAENRSFTLDEIEGILGLANTDVGPSGVGGPQAASFYSQPSPVIHKLSTGEEKPPRTLDTEVFYEYTHPDGRPSHLHLRRDYSDGSKEMPYFYGDGQPGRPGGFWPIYNERNLGVGQVIFVVEGEKCVDMVNLVDDSFNGLPIRALTTSSAAELEKYSPEIAQRLGQLAPAGIILWPDNDDPGQRAMRRVRSELERAHLSSAIIEPLQFDSPEHGDVADYLETGGSLAVVINSIWGSLQQVKNGAGLNVQRLHQLLDQTVVLSPTHFIFAQTQTPVKVDNPNLEALWYSIFGAMPPATAVRELRGGLINKGILHPTDVAYRHLAADNGFWWRPTTHEDCYRVTADEITREADPPETMVLVPRSTPRFSTQVDETGHGGDFHEFCAAFGLDATQEALVLTWLVSALTGRKTPILLFKGDSSTGKTTLATYLCSVIDPDVPTLAAAKIERDVREFVRTAQRHPALLLDNVGAVPGDVEDALSKLVTGEAAPLRILYEDVIETVHLQRAIAITTTAWDISKGDLASRMWPIEPRVGNRFMDEEDIAEKFDPMVARLRGYAFKQCQNYYLKSRNFQLKTTPLRVGGRVLLALGFDPESISREITATRARVITEGEPWLDAIVDLWEHVRETGPYEWSPTDLCQYLKEQTHDEPSAKMLANFVRPRQGIFINYGFSISWGRTNKARFYRFKGLKMSEEITDASPDS